MTFCYWGVCQCPDVRPCAEHSGVFCGEWSGQRITGLGQVQDSVTGAIEAAIASMSLDEDEIDTLIADLETRRDDLQAEKRGIEADARHARRRAERRAVRDRAETANDSVRNIDQEMSAILDQIDQMSTRWQVQTERLHWLLIVPYFSSSGYCSCYDAKKARLASVQQLISDKAVERNVYQSQLFGLRHRYPKMVISFVVVIGLIAVWAWIVFGFGQAWAIAVLIALLVVSLALIVLLLSILDLKKQIARLTRQITQLQLSYYRMQQILTCQPNDPTEPVDDDSWWIQLLEESGIWGE